MVVLIIYEGKRSESKARPADRRETLTPKEGLLALSTPQLRIRYTGPLTFGEHIRSTIGRSAFTIELIQERFLVPDRFFLLITTKLHGIHRSNVRHTR